MSDVLDSKYGLQQDDYSTSGVTFGDQGHLQVIGWSGRNGYVKYYILKCIKCCQDKELFGEGVFKSLKGHLVNGGLPCGCARSPRRSKAQYQILCYRKAIELGYRFLGFTGKWKGIYTKVKLICEKHGEWSSGSINHLINSGYGCPRCKLEAIGEAQTKPDDIMITSFHKSGAFHPDTKFWRSDRPNNRGHKIHWFMQCPECGETGESLSGNLRVGKRPCACSSQRQQECYVNWVVNGDNKVAIKFGIARDSKQRIKAQNRQAAYEVTQYQVYKFTSVEQCKKAERECKKELECGILLKRDMPDGYSETTWVYNLTKIQDIYKRNGGILQNTLDTDQITA